MKLHLARILIGLAIVLLFVAHAGRSFHIDLIDRFENIIYDLRLRLTMPGKGDPRVVILDIDEKSLGEVGRWPWSRNIVARLTDKLFDQYGIAVLAFDIVWAERDNSSGMEVLDTLAASELKENTGFQSAYRRLRGGLDYDSLLAEKIKGRPVVLGHYLSSESAAVRANAIPAPVLPKGSFEGRDASVTHWDGYTGNLPIYLANAAGAGFLNPIVDVDGVVRRVPMLAELDGEYHESFALATVRAWLALDTPDRKQPGIEPRFESAAGYARLESLVVGPLRIPVDENAAALVPYAGPRFSFSYLSLADVLADRVKPEQLRGKLAIVGTTAPGLLDLRSTPVERVYPGVEAHANLVAGMLGGRMKQTPGFVIGAEVVLLLVVGVALSLLIAQLSALWATTATAIAMLLVTGLGLQIWSKYDTVLPLANSILMIGAIYITNMVYGYFVESRSKRQFTELFGQYVPPELVDRMAHDPRKYSMEPKAAELTILFSDVRGFTSISEALKPEDLREYINAYLTDMSGIIRSRYRGTLDKYIGDAIMAFWGAPVEDPQHARNGVLAALYMQKECEVLNAKFAARGWPELKIGVGLNTGQVRVGDMGSQVRRAYTVMGDAVNVASRLEGRTKYYGVGVLVGEATSKAVPDMVFREVDRIKVKGKDEALTIYEPIGPAAEVDAEKQDELRIWSRALSAYRAQNWDQTESDLASLQKLAPGHGLYELYSERVAAFRKVPPSQGWNGVTAFDEK